MLSSVMARRPSPEDFDRPLTKAELAERERRLSLLSPNHVADAYRQAHGACRMDGDRLPSARAFQELDPEAHIITVCHSGVRSLNVALWLRNQGFEKVQSLSGGIDSWSREVDPKVPRY